MSNITLRDVSENYSKAQRSRRKDFLMVKRANRKVMTIHLGGIYIECLLKSIIINKNGIIKSAFATQEVNGRRYKYICWYNLMTYNRINTLMSIDDSVLLNNKNAQNPEHNLVTAFRQIDELNNGAPTQIIRILGYLNRPLNKSYIDYRYMSDDEVSDADYQKWEENFLDFFEYFNHRKPAFTFSI